MPACKIADFSINFNDLPEEIQLKIFSYLSKSTRETSALVCKSWREKISSLWTVIRVGFNNIDIQDAETLENLLKRTTMLKSLTLRNLTWGFVVLNLPSKPSLRHLDIGHSYNSLINEDDNDSCSSYVSDLSLDTIVMSLALKCSHIESLNLEGCIRITDDAVHAISDLKYLKSLNLTDCYHVSSEAIRSLVMKCDMLERLYLEGIRHLDDRDICAIAIHLKNTLQCITVDGTHVTDKSYQQLEQFIHLTSLSIGCADSMSDASLLYIKNLANLRKLKVVKSVRNERLSSQCIADFFLGPQMKNLCDVKLHCLPIDDLGLRNLATCCPNLRILDLPYCWKVTDIGLQAIITKCQYLAILNLAHVYNVTLNFLGRLPYPLPHLVKLILPLYGNINHYDLRHIMKYRSWLNITYVR